MGWIQTGRPWSAMRRNIGRNSGALNGLPATLVNSCTPRAPSEPIARSISLMLASMSLSGNAAMNVGNRLVESFDGLRQVLSLANPPLEAIGPPAVAAELARIANDCLAEICGKYPHAFPTFIAALPLNDIEASIKEMDRAIGSLGARGVQLFTNVAGKPLSAPEFRPIFRR